MPLFFNKSERNEGNIHFDVFKMKYPRFVSTISLILLFLWIFLIQIKQVEIAIIIWVLLSVMILLQLIEIRIFQVLSKKRKGKKIQIKNSILGISEISIEK